MENTTFSVSRELEQQEWEMDLPDTQEKHCTCIQRCNPPKGTDKMDCKLKRTFVGNYTRCNDTIDVLAPAVKGEVSSWPIPEGKGWFWICGKRAKKGSSQKTVRDLYPGSSGPVYNSG